MTPPKLRSGLLHPSFKKDNDLFDILYKESKRMGKPQYHLKKLIGLPKRFEEFSLKIPGFFLDFSRQRLDHTCFDYLIDLARKTRACERFRQMAGGEIVNTTENRAALHTAARDFSTPGFNQEQYRKDFCNVNSALPREQLVQVSLEIKKFSDAVRQGLIKGSTGKPFTHAVVVGIGGSYLGCQFAYQAMKLSAGQKRVPGINLSFLANVDIDEFAGIVREIDPGSTMWIVISKSYTTTETLANLNQIQEFLRSNGLSPKEHLVSVTSKGSPGDDPANPVLATFKIFDFIGGRFSVSSAVGGLPLSLAFGHDIFERFLRGCHAMDTHALTAPEPENIPLTAALISIWNTVFLNYPAQAVIPYCSSLSKLAPHVQQLYMESIGKSASPDGRFLSRPAGSIIFGEPGTNAQHSFFQLVHQGPAFATEFIGVVQPAYKGVQVLSKGVTNHQELWANMLAQTLALATGKDHEDPAKSFPGNRPSSVILIQDLAPESIGMLLGFYEARTVLEGFLLGVNPFDQFGVEFGKVLAKDIRQEIRTENQDCAGNFDHMDPGMKFYLQTLFKGEIQ